MQNQKTNLSGQGKSFPLFKSLSSILRYGTEKSSGNDELDLHKQKPTVHEGFQHWKYCILYFSSKTLSYLHKRLPGKQRKADDVMEGEMIMSSFVNGIQPTITIHSHRFAGHSGQRFKYLIPLHFKNLQSGRPLHRRQVTILNRLRENLHHTTRAIMSVQKQEEVMEEKKKKKNSTRQNSQNTLRDWERQFKGMQMKICQLWISY